MIAAQIRVGKAVPRTSGCSFVLLPIGWRDAVSIWGGLMSELEFLHALHVDMLRHGGHVARAPHQLFQTSTIEALLGARLTVTSRCRSCSSTVTWVWARSTAWTES